MPEPSPKLLQLSHDNAVVDLVPTVHDQMAGHGIHGVELAAGVGGTQHRLVVCASSDGMCEACDSGVTRAPVSYTHLYIDLTRDPAGAIKWLRENLD